MYAIPAWWGFASKGDRQRNRNRNRNLKTSKALFRSQEHQGTSLFTSAVTNQREVFQRAVKRSSGLGKLLARLHRWGPRVDILADEADRKLFRSITHCQSHVLHGASPSQREANPFAFP